MAEHPKFEVLSADAVGAMAVVRLQASPEQVNPLFSRLPKGLDHPTLVEMIGVDQGLLNQETEDTWIFTPHGGVGVLSALRSTFESAAWQESAEERKGVSALLPLAKCRAQAKLILQLMAMENPPELDPDAIAALTTLPKVFLMGTPNAGKSTLFNALSSDREVIVSSVAGTTRDAIEGVADIGKGWKARIFDSPGLREGAESEGESAGIALSQQLRKEADLVIWLTSALSPDTKPNFADWQLYTKIDQRPAPEGVFGLSSIENRGLEALRVKMREHLFESVLAKNIEFSR